MEIRRKSPLMLTLVILLVLFAVLSLYFYRQLSVLKANPRALAQQEAQELINEVGKLIVLPTDEQPTIATVSDAEKLKDQPFFANAKNNHKVLIFTKAKKAILYDPEMKKIVEVAPINIGNPEGTTTETSAETETSTSTE